MFRFLGGKMLPYLKKGTKVFVRGRLSAKTYTTRTGEIKVSLSVMASEVQLCGFTESADRPQSQPAQPSQPTVPMQSAVSASQTLVDDDDIPDFLR